MTNYRKLILRKLLEHGYVGGRHTNVHNVPKGFPSADTGEIQKAYRELEREGFFIRRPKPNGLHVSLNPRMIVRIREILQEPD